MNTGCEYPSCFGLGRRFPQRLYEKDPALGMSHPAVTPITTLMQTLTVVPLPLELTFSIERCAMAEKSTHSPKLHVGAVDVLYSAPAHAASSDTWAGCREAVAPVFQEMQRS